MAWTELYLRGAFPPWEWPHPLTAAREAEIDASCQIVEYGIIPVALSFIVGFALALSSNPALHRAGLITISAGTLGGGSAVMIIVCVADAKAKCRIEKEEKNVSK
ncbi:MAG: hypothetical protein H7A36_07685 [Chlamydiales bacterium]|nr:hypothetical protein [Chlamydiales bacterium]